jgi:hypothetical protein
VSNPTSFATDIGPMFTQLDIDHMKVFFDLSDYSDVKANAQGILNRLQGIGVDVMPPPPAEHGDGPWSAEKNRTI